MTYTLRRTWPHSTDDYVFRYEGKDVGRCYLRTMTGSKHQWSWTIYIGKYVNGTVEGVPVAGFTDTLDEAKTGFRKSFEAMIAAGVVRLVGDDLA